MAERPAAIGAARRACVTIGAARRASAISSGARISVLVVRPGASGVPLEPAADGLSDPRRTVEKQHASEDQADQQQLVHRYGAEQGPYEVPHSPAILHGHDRKPV